jgi:hypothetical protein
MTMTEIMQKAAKKAMQSQCRFKISALGFNRKGELVASATNSFRFCRKGGGLHAEAQVMKQAKRKGICTVLICRVNPNGLLLPIEPCENCMRLAEKLGIKIVSIQGDAWR